MRVLVAWPLVAVVALSAAASLAFSLLAMPGIVAAAAVGMLSPRLRNVGFGRRGARRRLTLPAALGIAGVTLLTVLVVVPEGSRDHAWSSYATPASSWMLVALVLLLATALPRGAARDCVAFGAFLFLTVSGILLVLVLALGASMASDYDLSGYALRARLFVLFLLMLGALVTTWLLLLRSRAARLAVQTYSV